MRALLVMAVLGLAAPTDAAPVRVEIERGDPLRVGVLPTGAAFEFAVRPSADFEPTRLFLWRAKRCDRRPKGLSPLPRVPGPADEGPQPAVFAAPRLSISSGYCVALQGRAPLPEATHAAVRAALEGLVRRLLGSQPPVTPRARRAVLGESLGALASDRVFCREAKVCKVGAVYPLAEVVELWIRGVGSDSGFAAVTQLAFSARDAARARQQAVDAVLASGARFGPALRAVQAKPPADLAAADLDAALDALGEPSACRRCSAQARADRVEAHELLGEEKAALDAFVLARANLDAATQRWIAGRAVTSRVDVQTASPAYTERVNYYVSGDLGVAMPLLGSEPTLAAFIGVNFYFAPVDKATPLSEEGGLSRRFSITAGLTLNEIEDAAGTVSGALGDRAALLGVGYRLTDYLRLGVGATFFRQRDPNPTVQQDNLRVAPYWALSVDLDVVGTVQGFFAQGD